MMARVISAMLIITIQNKGGVMALVKCKECGNPVSTKQTLVPNAV